MFKIPHAFMFPSMELIRLKVINKDIKFLLNSRYFFSIFPYLYEFNIKMRSELTLFTLHRRKIHGI